MNKITANLPSIVSHVLASAAYLAAVFFAYVYSNFNGIFGGGLGGVEPELIEFVPAVLVAASLIFVTMLYKRFKSVTIWESAVVIFGCTYILWVVP